MPGSVRASHPVNVGLSGNLKKKTNRSAYMTQDELWLKKYQEVKAFIETNHRNPSRHNSEERFKYCNWLKHNKNSSTPER